MGGSAVSKQRPLIGSCLSFRLSNGCTQGWKLMRRRGRFPVQYLTDAHETLSELVARAIESWSDLYCVAHRHNLLGGHSSDNVHDNRTGGEPSSS
jgi:hypothetical protein